MPAKIRKLFRFETVSCYAAWDGLETSTAFEDPSTSPFSAETEARAEN